MHRSGEVAQLTSITIPARVKVITVDGNSHDFTSNKDHGYQVVVAHVKRNRGGQQTPFAQVFSFLLPFVGLSQDCWGQASDLKQLVAARFFWRSLIKERRESQFFSRI